MRKPESPAPKPSNLGIEGLDPTDKAVRVANYCRNLRHDVEMIAHSCGVPHPMAAEGRI